MNETIKTWFVANSVDFLAISDVGLEEKGTHAVWVPSTTGAATPGLILVGNTRAAILMDAERWAARWKRDATKTSPSGRSISITLRLGGLTEMSIVSTYCIDTPTRNRDETVQERRWIAQTVQDARRANQIVVVAGDFNCYGDEMHDRQGPERCPASQRESQMFQAWTDGLQLKSTFKARHPVLNRYTYQNGATRSALDDIFITASHTHLIQASGIWIRSLNQGDHVGTPVSDLLVNGAARVRSQAPRGVKAIKVLNVKGKTGIDFTEFRQKVDEGLDMRTLGLGSDAPGAQADTSVVKDWLETSIATLSTVMYNTAKELWGEKSQAQHQINRAVSNKRTNRCNGQLKAARAAWQQPEATASDIAALVRKVQWPKWIVHPERTPAASPHSDGARQLCTWRTSTCPQDPGDALLWAESGWRMWKSVLRSRRDWRFRQRQINQRAIREHWMTTGNMRRLLRDTFGAPAPPIQLRGALVDGVHGFEYQESRAAVSTAMRDLLDSWIPPNERTQAPRHLHTLQEEDEAALPQFVKEWLLQDIKAGGTRAAAFQDASRGWNQFRYDQDTQKLVDRMVSKGVAPGFGGINQELWVAAPERIRRREREIFAVIIKTGVVPACMNHRQLIFLPKSEAASSVWERRGLPAWRPIMMQSALATRLFTAISSFMEERAPNHALQHGFQRNRTVQDASLATTLVLDRAVRRKEPLYVLSKDCEKCYDRIPRWVMSYIYTRLGVPEVLHRILMAFLAAGQIDVRSAYGWLSTGVREFGLGQGSVLSIRHIGYYMDILIEQQEHGPGAVVPTHHQANRPSPLATIVLVDDVVDIARTRAGIEHRAATSNMFTGIAGTGGVFGADKSFLIHHHPGRPRHEAPVLLNDGVGRAREVRTVSPADGFKHLGIVQSTSNIWDSTLAPVWERMKRDAARVIKAQPSLQQLRYIVNRVWLPRLLYRTQLNATLRHAAHVNKLIRHVARQVLKLPYGLPSPMFHDTEHGIGLADFEDECRASRVALAVRVLNTPHVPAYHLLVEALEDYQTLAGLTEHPLWDPLEPPSHLQGWTIDTIRAAAALGISTDIAWTPPPLATSKRPNDRSIWPELDPTMRRKLLALNTTNESKIRFVGDVATENGSRMAPAMSLKRKFGWNRKMCVAYAKMEPTLRQMLCQDGTDLLTIPVGRTVHAPTQLRMPPIDVAQGQFFVTAEFEVAGDTLELRGHEIGQRVDNGVWADANGLGWEIAVQWWQERRAGSGVWRVRPGRIAREYADVCVPVTPTPVGPNNDRWRKIVVWADTEHQGHQGQTNRSTIREAFRRSQARFQEVLRSGGIALTDRACVACKRLQHVQLCANCNTWHHRNCVRCEAIPAQDRRSTWARIAIAPTGVNSLSAGDGSVLLSGTPAVRGSWALSTPATRVIGQLHVHWKDLTSTRCECHALIAGLAASHDAGEQICDNQAAIQVLHLARDIATGKRPPSVKFTSLHRVEIRTMIALMRPGGTFTAVWVRSHQEHCTTTDELLQRRRQALATADLLASSGHTHRIWTQNSVDICWDWAQVVDEDERPVVGSTHGFLLRQATTRRRHAWTQRLQPRPPQYQTITTSALDMAELLSWNDQQRRFAWRAMGYVLHTNAIKHRMVRAWDPRCRVCEQATPDTQAHRYGATDPACDQVQALAADTLQGVYGAAYAVWLPDQDVYIPQWGAALSERHELTTRPWWHLPEGATALWRPMARVSDDLWVHAVQLQLLLGDAVHFEYARYLFLQEQETSTNQALLLPNRIQLAVRTCLPDAAHEAFHPSQVGGVWATGNLAQQYQLLPAALAISRPPQDQRSWWIDDVHVPGTALWWRQTLERHTRTDARPHTLWLACYEDSHGHAAARAAAASWYIHIPKGELRMRTRLAVTQTTQPSRRVISTRNPRAIWIGVIEAETSYEDHHHRQSTWTDALQFDYQQTWLVHDPTRHPNKSAGRSHDHLSWTPATRSVPPTVADAPGAVWIQATFASVYAAPVGWRTWPAANAHTLRWAQAWATSTRDGNRLHRGILSAIWTANHTHWSRTCTANIDAITTAGAGDALAEANDHIARGRRAQQHLHFALDTQLQRRRETRASQAQTWQAQRRADLQEQANMAATDTDQQQQAPHT